MDLGKLDRHADRPPFRQIADRLRTALDRGDLAPGDRLPSEAELTAHFGVARMTARQAVAELRAEGRVVAQHGRGVFVLPLEPRAADKAVIEAGAAALRHRATQDRYAGADRPDPAYALASVLDVLGLRLADLSEDVRRAAVAAAQEQLD